MKPRPPKKPLPNPPVPGPNKKKKRNNKSKKRGNNKFKQNLNRWYIIPAARGSRVQTRNYVQSSSASSITVRGYDMVYRVDSRDQLIDGAFVAIPSNPAYWIGTRIANIAPAYSQYRPLYLRFDYIPQVGTSNNGSIVSGTLWNSQPATGNYQQALITSNGGRRHTTYTRNSTQVRLKTNLNQNLYDLDGTINESTCPFMFMAIAPGVEGFVPGYYMVDYAFELKNPIGDGNEYEVDTKLSNDITSEDIWENTSAVVMSDTTTMGPGTVLSLVSLAGGVVKFLLNGSPLDEVVDVVLKLFKNRSKTKTKDDNNNNIDDNRRVINEIRCSYRQNDNGVISYVEAWKATASSDMRNIPLSRFYKADWENSPYGLVVTFGLLNGDRYDVNFNTRLVNTMDTNQYNAIHSGSLAPTADYYFRFNWRFIRITLTMYVIDFKGSVSSSTEYHDFDLQDSTNAWLIRDVTMMEIPIGQEVRILQSFKTRVRDPKKLVARDSIAATVDYVTDAAIAKLTNDFESLSIQEVVRDP